MNKIVSKDISVVVQGAVDNKVTKKCLKSIRKYLPNSQIILSTWEGSDISSFAGLYDVLVLNKDPEATIFDDKEKKSNNLNRIIVSSKNGIDKATRKYVLRLRSDLVLKNSNILKLHDDFEKRNPKASLFKKRVFAYDTFSIKYDPKKQVKQRMLFHISDWCYFGLKEDLLELFNIPLVEEPDFSRYFEKNTKPCKDIHTTRLWKMSPEQYFTSMNAKKIFKDFDFKNYLDITDENIRISENFIINNFKVFSQKEWGISTLKELYKNIRMFIKNPFIYYSDLEQLLDYKKYCNDNDIDISKVETIKKLYEIPYYEKLRKHYLQLLYISPLKKPGELISTVAYLGKFAYSLIKSMLMKK